MQLFHYHLVTSELRHVEARYLGKLGFRLIARYGRTGDEHVAIEPGISWEKLDHDGFKARLSELERGAVNVVVQPGHWRVPRVDHVGVALDDEEFEAVLARAAQWGLRVQEHGGRRTFVATNVGYRVEIHPPREWIDDLLDERDALRLSELQLRADEPETKARALADLLGVEVEGTPCSSATAPSASSRAAPRDGPSSTANDFRKSKLWNLDDVPTEVVNG